MFVTFPTLHGDVAKNIDRITSVESVSSGTQSVLHFSDNETLRVRLTLTETVALINKNLR